MFIGRSQELSEIGALFADPGCRLLMLLGPGGMGKTRLSIQAAAEQTHFAEGVCFVALTQLKSPELLRQYAEQQLNAVGAAEAARTAHSDYYLCFVARRDSDIKGRRQQTGLYELRIDLENIRAGLYWAVEHEQYDLITTPVLDCLPNFAEMSNRTVDILLLLKQMEVVLRTKFVDQTDPLLDQIAVRCKKLNSLTHGEIDHLQLEAILERTRQRKNQHERIYCLWVLGDYNGVVGDFGALMSTFEEFLQWWREMHDDFYIAYALVYRPFI